MSDQIYNPRLTKLAIPYKPVVLIILDGFGVDVGAVESPWKIAKRATFEEIERFYPFTTLQASGAAVGLPWGEEGNSEVGHLTIGSGRTLFHHLPRIIMSIQDGSFFQNPAFLQAAQKAKEGGGKFHIIGLFSSGSVHAYVEHLYALLEFTNRMEIKEVYLHLFTDGRDAPPLEAAKFVKQFEDRLEKKYPSAKIASLIGRHYAMDRDEHWDRIKTTYDLLTAGVGSSYQKASDHIENSYQKGSNDEFLEPGFLGDVGGKPQGRIENGDAVVFYNFREDSVRELTRAFVDEKFTSFDREKLHDLLFVTMTEYEKNLPISIAFPPLDVGWPLARVISEAGLNQVHIAETEKYAHVTYFFNGGQEKPFPGEERELIPSPKAPHFDEVPEMSASKVTDAVIASIQKYNFILANFANADMVGHTGNFQATVAALETLDFSIGKIIPKVLEKNGAIIITADHGNAEEKRYQLTGEKKTKHTTNPVPFYLIAKEARKSASMSQENVFALYSDVGGVLTDIAPTVLELLNIKKPSEMTGKSLLEKLL